MNRYDVDQGGGIRSLVEAGSISVNERGDLLFWRWHSRPGDGVSGNEVVETFAAGHWRRCRLLPEVTAPAAPLRDPRQDAAPEWIRHDAAPGGGFDE